MTYKKERRINLITNININQEKGITLISLVITIILLLILATVAINIAVDANGLFAKAKMAVTETNISQIEEGIELAKLYAIDMETFQTDKEKLTELLRGIEGVDDVIDKGDKLIVKYAKDREKEIEIGTNDRTVLQTEEELKDKIEDNVDLSKNVVKAYDAYGEEIENFEERWYYELRGSNKKEWQLNTDARFNNNEPAYIVGENNENIKDGTIIGEIPAYIVQIEDGTITNQGKVTSYQGLFTNIKEITHLPEDLKISPVIEKMQKIFMGTSITEIPKCFMTFSDSVTSLYELFSKTSITEIPSEFKIGNNVDDIYRLFSDTAIEKVPAYFTIPDSVKNMGGVFYNCKNLTTIEEGFKIGSNANDISSLFESTKITEVPSNFAIPNSVKNCEKVFYNCTKLIKVGEGFKIGSNVTTIRRLFDLCAKLENINIIIPEKVTDIGYIFHGAMLLDGTSSVTIEGNPTEYTDAFKETSAYKKDNPLKVYYNKGICTNIEEIKKTDADGHVIFEEK